MSEDSDNSQRDPDWLFPMSEEAEAAIDNSNEETEATTDDSNENKHIWDSELLVPVEGLVFAIVMMAIYFYVLQPVLVDINPIFAYEGGFRPGPRSIGELMLYVFLFGSWFLYASIRMIHSHGVGEFLTAAGRFLIAIPLIVIPDKYLPERYVIANSSLDE